MGLFRRHTPELEPEPVEKAPPSGPYSGRLAFDPDSGFHLADDGHFVVTPDQGKSWFYATNDDPSHLARYQNRVVEVQQTANRFQELSVEHGQARAEELIDPHHFHVQPQDAHFGGASYHPDLEAPRQTSHTDAWSEE